MDIIKILEQMDAGFGVDPEINVHKHDKNVTTVQLTKTFRGIRFGQQFQLINKTINHKFEDQMVRELEKALLLLQRIIDSHYREYQKGKSLYLNTDYMPIEDNKTYTSLKAAINKETKKVKNLFFVPKKHL